MRRPRIVALALGSLIVLLGLAAAAVVIASARTHAASPPRSAATPAPSSSAQPSPSAGRGYLGVDVRDASSSTGAQQSGAAVVSVAPGSGAAAAGLKPGDLIVSVDGRSVNSVAALTSALASHHAGDRVSLGIVSGGAQRTVQVTLGAQPPAQATPPAQALGPGIALPPDLLGPVLGALSGGSFNRFVSADITTKDSAGKTATLHLLAGTIRSASSTEVTVTPNGGGADKRFTVAPSTQINTGRGRVSALDLTAGMHVIVITSGSSAQAQRIIAVGGGLATPQPSAQAGSTPGRIRIPQLPRHRATPTASVQ